LEKSKLKKIIESLIFSSTKPISLRELKNFFTDESISSELIEEVISDIEGKYIDSGVVLKKVSTGYRFQVPEECNKWVSNFYPQKSVINGFLIFTQKNHKNILEH